MKVAWDYTNLANAYLKRPEYSSEAIDEMLNLANIKQEDLVCDVGAGAAHLTLMLANRGLNVYAVEPNDAMREKGIERTKKFKNIEWYEGVGEDTKQESNIFNLVTFGSSFNVTDRKLALIETYRILKKDGWFSCMWNHRDLNDPLQASIEDIIKFYIKEYDYGTRRQDQTIIIKESGLFTSINKIQGNVIHNQTIDDFLEGWKSHATLYRQAGNRFDIIIKEIQKMLIETNKESVEVPYITRMWMAKANK